MSSRHPYIFVALVGAMACHTASAPTELSELSTYLYREWPNSNDKPRERGLHNLVNFISDLGNLGEVPLADRAWELGALSPEDIEDIEHPDRSLDATVNVAVAYRSLWPITDHAMLQTLVDQTVAEPSSPSYTREFTNLEDPSCFPTAKCEEMRTFNDLVRKNLLLNVRMELFKDFRWVSWVDDDGEDRRAFYSRSWLAKPWSGAKDNVTLYQSYSIDVWIEAKDGSTWRYQTLWSESALGIGASDAVKVSVIKGGTDSIFQAGDEAISVTFHEGAASPEG